MPIEYFGQFVRRLSLKWSVAEDAEERGEVQMLLSLVQLRIHHAEK